MLIPFAHSIFKFKDRLEYPREIQERLKPTRRKQHNRISKPKPKHIKNAHSMNTLVLIPVFKSWFEANKTRFQIPISITEIESNRINMIFPTLSEVISANLYFGKCGYLEINVTAKYQDILWDLLLSYDAKFMVNKDGCFCNLCLEREMYPDIEIHTKDVVELIMDEEGFLGGD